MVSLRCKMLVKEELRKLGLQFIVVDLGMVEIMGDLTRDQARSTEGESAEVRFGASG